MRQGGVRGSGRNGKLSSASAHGVHENDYELFYGVFKCLYVICARQQDKHTNDIN